MQVNQKGNGEPRDKETATALVLVFIFGDGGSGSGGAGGVGGGPAQSSLGTSGRRDQGGMTMLRPASFSFSAGDGPWFR
jgi:hypothetical protein